VGPSILVTGHLVLLIVPLVGCLPPPVYQVQRSVRVPHPAVPLSDGQPLTGPIEVMAGLSNAGDLVKPTVGNADAAVEVPSVQARGELRFRVGHGQIALVGERAFASTSKKPDPTQAPIGDGDVTGRGLAFRYAIRTSDPRWSVGLDSEFLVWKLPSVEFRTCVANCENRAATTMEQVTATIASIGFGITPSFRSGPLTVFGGVYARSHPTVERKGTETGYADYDDVSDGPTNILVHVGLSYAIVGALSALVVINQDLTPDPVQYGPGIGVALSATIR
jgi:hypothetical protein